MITVLMREYMMQVNPRRDIVANSLLSVLYRTVPYCTVLYCTVQYCAVLYCRLCLLACTFVCGEGTFCHYDDALNHKSY